jgi:hypothetical protein
VLVAAAVIRDETANIHSTLAAFAFGKSRQTILVSSLA